MCLNQETGNMNAHGKSRWQRYYMQDMTMQQKRIELCIAEYGRHQVPSRLHAPGNWRSALE